jgi:hypothetical protein
MSKEIYKDIGMIVLYEHEPSGAHVNFKCYEISGYSQGVLGLFDIPFFSKKGAESSDDTTEKIEDAQTLICGTVKWDGCCHYNFGDEDGYIHLCGKHSTKNLIEVIQRVYNHSGKLMKDSADKTEFPL